MRRAIVRPRSALTRIRSFNCLICISLSFSVFPGFAGRRGRTAAGKRKIVGAAEGTGAISSDLEHDSDSVGHARLLCQPGIIIVALQEDWHARGTDPPHRADGPRQWRAADRDLGRGAGPR